ncbi:MAG: motility associated factor glycosyltransferase family protein [Candidatus Riflebacteria bacterium]|nr:motility associated factor glycosyltransferase family protein [Candidatus Riflebacteria bacterium]
MNSFLKKNLEKLRNHPQLTLLVTETSQNSPAEKYLIEPSKSGHASLAIVSSDGRQQAMHSRYNPVAEVEKQINISFSSQSHALILGMGLGYSIDLLLQKTSERSGFQKIIVVEPDPYIFMAALQATDMEKILSSAKIEWCVGLSPDEFGEKWNLLLDWAAVDSISIIEHPPSLARNPVYFERIKEKLRYFSNRSKGNIVTLMHTGSDFHTNYFRNASTLSKFPGIGRLFGKFSGVPGIVVGAGPSLEKNAHLLSEIRNKFLIIATDTAFRQLKARNLKPDIVCAADPSYENSLDFIGVENESDVFLAIEPMTHPDIISSFNGPKFLMTFGGGLSPWLEPMREPIGKLVCWGSIATTAFDLARNCGCNPIIFIGLDMSFQDGKLYARGSYSDDLFMDQVHSFSSLEHEIVDYISVRGVHKFENNAGETLYTDHNMFLYKGWFEDQFRQTPGRLLINATEGGILDSFVERMTLRDVIDKYLQNGCDIGKLLSEAHSAPLKADVSGMAGALSEAGKKLNKFCDQSRQCLSTLKKLKRRNEDISVSQLSGESKTAYFELVRIHDEICDSREIFAWFSIHQTRFITRHSMQLKKLKNEENSKLFEWIKELEEFYDAVQLFYDYQMPLLKHAIETISSK